MSDEDTKRFRHVPVQHDLKEVPGFEGLAYCTCCGAGEGELLAYCPGYKLSQDTMDACFDGNVIDLTFWKQSHYHEEPFFAADRA